MRRLTVGTVPLPSPAEADAQGGREVGRDSISKRPATPSAGEPDAMPLPVLRALDRYLAIALHEVRKLEPFAALTAAQWAVLVEVICARVRGDETVNQLEISRASGYCVRTVRTLVAELVDAQLIVAPRACGRGASYGVGSELQRALRDFASGLDSRNWTRGTARLRGRPAAVAAGSQATPAVTAARSAVTPAAIAVPTTPAPAAIAGRDGSEVRGPGTLGSTIAGNLRRVHVEPAAPRATPAAAAGPRFESPSTLTKKKISDCSSERPADANALRAVAFRALGARHRHAFPDRPPPTTFAAADIEAVVVAAADLALGEQELDQLHLDAIAGASDKSKRQPPTVSFIWGNREYFLQNAADGRAKRLATDRAKLARKAARARRSAPVEPHATLEQVEELARRAKELLDGAAGGLPEGCP
jgi:hypothetical protein